jgi:hypothetical protein
MHTQALRCKAADQEARAHELDSLVHQQQLEKASVQAAYDAAYDAGEVRVQ